MVRTKLDKLKQEINHYLGIPYYINKTDSQNVSLVGKADHKQINLATQKVAKSENLNLTKLSSQDIYRLQKRHHIGIDCSGLVYHLLDFYYKQNTGKSIQNLVIGTDDKTGPRRINAYMFSHPQNSHLIKDFSQIKTADLIVTNHRKHILFVVDINKNQISYVHSSQKTKIRGVHYGRLTITHPQKDLTYQQFYETLETHSGDAIYRLHIFD